MNQDRGTLTHRAAGSMLWLGLGSGFQAGTQLLMFVVLARLVTPEEFGLVGAGLLIVAFCGVFSQVGLAQALIQRSGLQQAHIRTAFTSSLLLSLILAGLVAAAAPAVAAFFGMPALIVVLRALAPVILIQGVGVVAESLLRRDLRFDVIAGAMVTSYVVGYGVVGISTAVAGWGVWSLVAAYGSRTLVHSAIVLARRRHAMRPQLEREALRALFSFGFGASLSSLNNQLASKADALIVGRWLGASALGLYERAYQFVIMPTALVGQILDQVLFPTMSQRQDDLVTLGRVFLRCLSVVALLSAPWTALFLVFSPELVRLLLGPRWIAAVVLFRVLAVAVISRTGAKVADSVVRARGAVYRRAWRQAVYAASVFLAALAGQMWGLQGVAVGVLIALTMNYVLTLHLALRLVPVGWRAVAGSHGPGALLFLVAMSIFHTGGELARSAGLPAAVVVAAGIVPFGVLVGVVLKMRTAAHCLEDGRWALGLAVGILRRRTAAGSEPALPVART